MVDLLYINQRLCSSVFPLITVKLVDADHAFILQAARFLGAKASNNKLDLPYPVYAVNSKYIVNFSKEIPNGFICHFP